jgi:Beta-1,3-glucanase
VTNFSDPNINVLWGFCEFTYNSSQLYANISYVDFVSVPIALRLTNTSGGVQTVTGMRSNGLATICAQLQQQSSSDSVPGWGQCVYTNNGQQLRALSPNNLMVTNSSAFSGYFDPYVQQVWQRYRSQALSIKTSAVTTSGEVSSSNNQLVLGGESFSAPSTRDIFSSNSGPFTTGSDGTRNTIIPQLAAAFNRSTLLETSNIPSPLSTFYGNSITNHFSRIVHANQVDGRGYAFPYDDVNPSDAGDQSGEVNDPNPSNWAITVGGGQYS